MEASKAIASPYSPIGAQVIDPMDRKDDCEAVQLARSVRRDLGTSIYPPDHSCA